jgi:hypothetical protein
LLFIYFCFIILRSEKEYIIMGDEKVWTREEVLKMWPQAAGELRGFKKALERRAGLTASQLGMALQLAEAEYQRLLTPKKISGYKPAKSPESITVGRTDCPLIVLRSHPDFPDTLSSELDGAWSSTNPAWPAQTVKWILERLKPPCHTDWADFLAERTEERDGLKAIVIYVRPGPESIAAKEMNVVVTQPRS